MSDKISDKDKKDWENFLSDKSRIPNKDLNITNENIIKTKTFDFHGFSLDEANETIEKIIKESHANGIRKLIIITGKGLHSENEKDPYKSKDFGILKYSIPEYINSNEELCKKVKKIYTANKQDGGGGAIIIKLKFTK